MVKLWSLGFENSHGDVEQIEIEYIVYHNSSYQGGQQYGSFGGYDISLLKLGRPEIYDSRTCIPDNDCLKNKKDIHEPVCWILENYLIMTY